MAVSVVVGLGNPGASYAQTRHNVGFRAVQACAESYGLAFRRPFLSRHEQAVNATGPAGPVVFVKPLCYMNRSGVVLPRVMQRAGAVPERLLVVCDNLDLEVGRLRLKRGGGTAGHNGLKSIVSAIESTEFYRLYIGIGRPKRGETVVEYVLGSPGTSEFNLLEDACRRAGELVREAIEGDLERVMNDCNRRGT